MLRNIKVNNTKKYIIIVCRQLLVIVLSIIALFPIYFMVITALKSQEEYILNKLFLPSKIAWGNFIDVFVGKNFGIWFLNSSLLMAGTVILSIIVSIFAAYGVIIYTSKLTRIITNFIISLLVLPPVIMLIPLFVLFVKFKLTNSHIGIILLYAGLTLPFSIYLLVNFFKEIPYSIIEAAHIDGASSMYILRKIIIPLSKPPIITLLVVNGLWVWNELLIALIFLQKDSLKTLMVGLTVYRSQYTLNVPLTMLGLVIATIPPVIAYLIGQKYFQEGLTAGSIK